MGAAGQGARGTDAGLTGCAEVLHRGLAMQCFGCGRRIDLASGERVGFRDTCAGCGGDLHCCRNCTLHDPGAHNQCREPNAEWVSERERANRCEYFTPASGVASTAGNDRERARHALDDLFRKK